MTIMKIQLRIFAAKNNLTLFYEDDKDNSDAIECALEMVEMEFLNVTITTDDHNEDSVTYFYR